MIWILLYLISVAFVFGLLCSELAKPVHMPVYLVLALLWPLFVVPLIGAMLATVLPLKAFTTTRVPDDALVRGVAFRRWGVAFLAVPKEPT